MAFELIGQAEDYAQMDLAALEAEKRALEAIRDRVKGLLSDMQPHLDAAYAAQQREEAAKADPALTQHMGWPIPPETLLKLKDEPQTDEEREYTLKVLGEVMGWPNANQEGKPE
ncbi:MAG: hypothetical protein JNJ61_25780 [Anaerolineae bacterium]|nr:hypothetical protein [Anaerolineae bacterium]